METSFDHGNVIQEIFNTYEKARAYIQYQLDNAKQSCHCWGTCVNDHKIFNPENNYYIEEDYEVN